jgi:hypothetical protein
MGVIYAYSANPWGRLNRCDLRDYCLRVLPRAQPWRQPEVVAVHLVSQRNALAALVAYFPRLGVPTIFVRVVAPFQRNTDQLGLGFAALRTRRRPTGVRLSEVATFEARGK